ncbi:MAG: DUF4143 domain-containing protein [Treponema sp.]|nr:DUF4143 domain-containing protein [Treponema sp.]
MKAQHVDIQTAQVLSYLKAFCNAFLMSKVSRADVKGLKIFEVGEKYYFEDLGLRNAIVNFEAEKDIGKIMENAVYNHLVRLGFEVFVGRLDDREIDFYCMRQGRKLYVQVAYLIADAETHRREIGNLEAVHDNYPKYVVCMNPLLHKSNSNGIEFYHLRDFLLKEDF